LDALKQKEKNVTQRNEETKAQRKMEDRLLHVRRRFNGGCMNKDSMFDLGAFTLIAVLALITAYLTFGILDSSASAELQQYSVGGAIAGALVSISIFASVYLQLRGSSEKFKQERENAQQRITDMQRDSDNKLEALRAQHQQEQDVFRRQIQELQQKLIRGVPRPIGFVPEVFDQQRFVFARPEAWEHRGGSLVDIVLPLEKMVKDDLFQARFTCSYVPITAEMGSPEDYYQNYQTLMRSADTTLYVEAPVFEYIQLGGDPNSVKSLKLVMREYVEVWKRIDPLMNKEIIEFREIEKSYYQQILNDEQAKVEATTNQAQDAAAAPNTPEQAKVEAATNPAQDAVAAPNTAEQPAPAEPPKTLATPEMPNAPEQALASTDESITVEQPKSFVLEVLRMIVICYNENLENVLFFDFWDDTSDFANSSDIFNKILQSTRFLT
jgi:hypothetical protein